MTAEDHTQKKYCSIVSGRWKKIKEDPAKLIAYNNRAKQMKDEAEKPTEVCMVAERPKKAPKSPEFVDTDPDDTDPDDTDDEEEEPAVTSPEDTDTEDSDDEEEELCSRGHRPRGIRRSGTRTYGKTPRGQR